MATTDPERPRWHRRLIIGAFAAQFLIPLAALLGSPAPTRLGFQMYSGEGELDIHVVTESGQNERVAAGDLLANGRGDIDWVSNLRATDLCSAWPDAVEVVVTQKYSYGDKVARHSCPH